MKYAAWLALFFSLLTTTLWADIIILHNGGRIEGKIVAHGEDSITILSKWGRVKILRDKIKKIEKGESKKQIYERRLKTVERDDAHGYYKLAMWCKDNDMDKEMSDCLEKCIDLDPSHRRARIALGHKYYRGQWVTYGEYMKARGFVYYAGKWMTEEEYTNRKQGMIQFEGRWMTKEQYEELRKVRMARINWGYSTGGSSNSGSSGSSASRPPKPIEVPEDLKDILKMARSKNRDKRIKAYQALQSKGEKAVQLLRLQLIKEKEKKIKGILDYFRRNGGTLRQRLGALLNQHRQAALSFIRDAGRYSGKGVNPTCDKLVGAVRQVYQHPFKEVIAHNKRLQKLTEELRVLVDDLKTYGGLPENYDYEVEKLDKKISKAINMERHFSPNGSFEVLAYNKRVRTSAGKEERACALITNKYRMMMGLRPLKIDEPLTQAARKHSADMRTKGYFSHNSPDGRGPAQRCAAEGANYYAGENIAMGMATGEGAFRAWYNSSGHHRNMLGKGHYSIGLGRSQSHWTQLFGVSTKTR